MGLATLARYAVAHVAIIVVVGCGELAGISDYAVGDISPAPEKESGAACGDFGPAGECAACIEESCCTEAAACSASDDCASFGQCLAGCDVTSGSCRGECVQAHEKSALAEQYLACMIRSCGTRCADCGGLGAVFGSACESCHSTQACVQTTACVENAECSSFIGCLTEKCSEWIPDPACRAQCGALHPDARGAFFAVASKATGCAADCGWGKHWDCVDSRQWPVPEPGASPAEVRVTVVGGPSGFTAEVKPCLVSNDVCDDAKPTDAAGTVTFVIPQAGVSNPQFRYFEVQGSDLVPELVYFMHPLLGARATRTIQVTPSSYFIAILAASGRLPRSDTGYVVAWLADCVGAIDVYDPESTGVTFTIDAPLADPRPIYTRGAQPDPSLGAGQIAWFLEVPEGRWNVTGLDAQKRQAASASVRVRAGMTTWVYLNLPFATQ